jgi:hypothetical protein
LRPRPTSRRTPRATTISVIFPVFICVPPFPQDAFLLYSSGLIFLGTLEDLPALKGSVSGVEI